MGETKTRKHVRTDHILDDNASHYLQFQNLPFVTRAAKRPRADHQHSEKDPTLFRDTSTELPEVDIAAQLLLSLATSTTPTPSSMSEPISQLSKLLTPKGESRFKKKNETRVRPPSRVTRLLDDNWPSIRMPDVRSAMEAEDWVVLFACSRNDRFGSAELQKDQEKLLNFKLSHYEMPMVKAQLANLTNSLSCSDRGSEDKEWSKQEVKVLAEFLKERFKVAGSGRKKGQRNSAQAKGMLDHSTINLPFADRASINSIKLNGIVKSGSIIAGVGHASLSMVPSAESGATPKEEGLSFEPFPTRNVQLEANKAAPQKAWKKLENSSTVMGSSSGWPTGPAIQSAEKPASTSSATVAAATKTSRGRQPCYDDIVEWCIRVKRAAVAKGLPLSMEEVVTLANNSAFAAKINISTLRKRIKRTLGITWMQIGTEFDVHASDVGSDDASVVRAVKLF